ncbi:MAG: serpin family protein [Lachnospiraceae bacterium]|nr:serpin family protein [Lachnospiraceae bacterium]
MKREHILTALEEISDKHIGEAGKSPKRKKRALWMSAVAAMLVIAIGIGILAGPMRIRAYAVALPSEARITKMSDYDDYNSREEYLEAVDLARAESKQRTEVSKQAVSALSLFFTKGTKQFLVTDDNDNKLWSPVNAYIGLAMLTELTEGNTRKQILDLLNAPDTEALRRQVSAVWESVYQKDEHEICVLANSLWWENGIEYNQNVMDALSYHYYASVYRGDLGSDKINKDIANWINDNTGNFLKDSTANIKLSQDIVMALYSTLYFQSKWTDQFSSNANTEDVFYMPTGEKQVTYMNKKQKKMNYYWGENYGAVCLYLKNGCRMWFVLPDEGKTTKDVLEDGTYMEMVLTDDWSSSNEWQNRKYLKVNLSVPKFDVSSTLNLREGLEHLGVTDIFEYNADFSNVTTYEPVFLTAVNQSVRVEIDEEGVKAATYIELPAAGEAPPPEEIIDFVLDRPFLFVIANGNIPLFAGCVNNPQ